MSHASEPQPKHSQSELLVDHVARKVAVHWARRLACSRLFRPDEIDDIEGELILGLAERLPAFDPSQSSLLTYAHACMRCRAISLVRGRRAAKRGKGGAARPFSDLAPGPDGSARSADEARSSDARRHRGVDGHDAIDAIDVRRSIEQVAERLDERGQRIVFAMLQDPDADFGRMLGLAPRQVRRLLRAMAPEFERGGLGKSQPRCPRRRRIA